MKRSIPSDTNPVHPPRRGDCLRALLVGLAALILFLSASESLPPTWDEGDTDARADSVLAWSSRAISIRRFDGRLWTAPALRSAFPNTVSREGHPAGYVILTAAGKAFWTRLDAAFGRWGLLHEQTVYRFGAIFLWSCALGAVFLRIARSFTRASALFAILSILCLPRVFAHAQIAFGDSPLMSGMLLTWAFFPRGRARPARWLVWGFFLGLTASMKFTGALAFFPFLLWTLIRRERRALLPGQALGWLAALFLFWLLNPPIWHAPFSGLARYVELNTHREAYNIGIFFLGKMYSLARPLPWWNSLFWTAVTVPTGLLLSAAAVLAGAAFRRRRGADPAGSFFGGRRRGEIGLLFWNWILLIAIRAIPGLPVHDGVRLFVAAFPFLAILAGLGLARLWTSRGAFPKIAAAAVLLGSAGSLVLYFPQGLSYYNLLIGGLPGAARAGMEVTYYWDGLDEEISRSAAPWSPTGAARPCLFGAASPATLRRWIEWDLVPPRSETITSLVGRPDARRRLSETPFGYYILQNRASGLTPFDREILRTQRPVWYKTAGMWKTPKFLKNTPWDLSRVPLILIYEYDPVSTAEPAEN